MIDWFRAWSKGIVCAVIIGTLIEMILPDNNSKKYIKIIIGIFVVYTIISPVIEQFSGSNLDDYIELDEYIEASSNSIADKNSLSDKASSSIKRIYIQNLQSDIKTRLKEKGYIADNINIGISNDDSYNIEKLEISISEKIAVDEGEKQAKSIVDSIRYIKVKIEDNSENKGGVIDDNDKNTIKKIIKENYDIPESNIHIF